MRSGTEHAASATMTQITSTLTAHVTHIARAALKKTGAAAVTGLAGRDWFSFFIDILRLRFWIFYYAPQSRRLAVPSVYECLLHVWQHALRAGDLDSVETMLRARAVLVGDGDVRLKTAADFDADIRDSDDIEYMPTITTASATVCVPRSAVVKCIVAAAQHVFNSCTRYCSYDAVCPAYYVLMYSMCCTWF